jgi:hypothetical protein
MAFKTEGFLSPTMEAFRVSLREVPAYKLWLEFAEELNRLGWDMLDDHETPTTDNQRLITSVLFIRRRSPLSRRACLQMRVSCCGAPLRGR